MRIYINLAKFLPKQRDNLHDTAHLREHLMKVNFVWPVYYLNVGNAILSGPLYVYSEMDAQNAVLNIVQGHLFNPCPVSLQER